MSAVAYDVSPYEAKIKFLIASVADGQKGVPSVARIRLCFFQDQQQSGKLVLSFTGTGPQTTCELWFGKYEYYSEQTGVRDIVYSQSPYYDSSNKDNEKQLKIAAYAARAYEAVYNCYFRDNRNRPYYIDGQVEYNKWIPTRSGGDQYEAAAVR